MCRRFFAREFRIAALMQLRYKIVLLAIAVALTAAGDLGARDGSKDWTVLQNCRLIVNPANDGDSFHVSAGANEYIFRVCLVDTPETEGTEPGRLIEQAKYFEITVPQAIEVGEAAKAFTREKLAEPFAVFTRMSDAMGRSKTERFYAFVQTKEGDLGEQLVRNGLARVHGAKLIPPGFSSSQPEHKKLQQFEDEAKQEKIGGWGINAGRLNVRAEKPNTFTVFTPQRTSPARTGSASSVSSSVTPSTTSVPTATIATSTADKTNAQSSDEEIASGKININTATEKELQTIPGIGPVTARRIIEARPFRSADDLRRVNGIGDKKYEVIRPYFQ
jgi:competence ComEA-like helix-hairpin-helix protein